MKPDDIKEKVLKEFCGEDPMKDKRYLIIKKAISRTIELMKEPDDEVTEESVEDYLKRMGRGGSTE